MITLYISRNKIVSNYDFNIFDANGNQKYSVVSEKNPVNKIYRIINSDNTNLSKIIQNNFINNKFLIFYNRQKLLISSPINSINCDFHIYGMPWYITKDAICSNYAIIDVDSSAIMTHKKVWTSGKYYSQIDITNKCFEIPTLSIAICMELYILLTEKDRNSVPNI